MSAEATIPNRTVEPEDLRAAAAAAQSAARHLRLALRNKTWRGRSGNWQGAGTGSSIDFQDHREYVPGDDPRHIDWQAYARSGHYSMKLYREEVSPRIDLALDVSASMFFRDDKLRRSLELFHFCAECAFLSGASLRSYVVGGLDACPWPEESFRAFRCPDFSGLADRSTAPVRADRVPWRRGALRILVSDLLFPGSPESVLAPFAAGQGWGVVLIPFCASEAAAPERGNVELNDCESGVKKSLHISEALATRYAANYTRHFDLWKSQSAKYAIRTARVEAGTGFSEALRVEALPAGIVDFSQ